MPHTVPTDEAPKAAIMPSADTGADVLVETISDFRRAAGNLYELVSVDAVTPAKALTAMDEFSVALLRVRQPLLDVDPGHASHVEKVAGPYAIFDALQREWLTQFTLTGHVTLDDLFGWLDVCKPLASALKTYLDRPNPCKDTAYATPPERQG